MRQIDVLFEANISVTKAIHSTLTQKLQSHRTSTILATQ